MKRQIRLAVAALTAFSAFAIQLGSAPTAGADQNGLGRIKHLIVIFQENRSFDNLYGQFEDANGLDEAGESSRPQVDTSGQPYTCLPQSQRCSPQAGAPLCLRTATRVTVWLHNFVASVLT